MVSGFIHPERNAIIIGTQDMLLSRALNRGYGMSRFRWPMHFGLLNNDCLWIFDEVQLMGNGLATGVQLDGFRSKLWPTAKPCVTWWMSATTSQDAFATVDRTDLNAPAPPSFTLTKEERQSDEIAPRLGPYETVDINQAHNFLGEIVEIQKQNQGTAYRQALDHVLAQTASTEALILEPTAVIRADDVFGLFSTEPDLAGGFTDISPFVRSLDLNCDVAVYWRPFQNQPSKEIARPTRDELVNVPAFTFSKFLADSKQSAFQWDEDAERWTGVRGKSIISGMTLLLPVSAGGYSSTTGWTGEPQDKPSPLPVPEIPPASLFDDTASQTGWQSLDDHTAAVTAMADHLAKSLGLPEAWQAALTSAGHWHDVGKAHPRWQSALPLHPDNRQGPWGKFEGKFVSRITFRHEALSLLAAWTPQPQGIAQPTKLILYLIATHHGKVRTVLQSSGNDDFFGWHETDEPLTIDNGSQIFIDLSVRNFFGTGEVDWTKRTLTPTRPSWTNVIDELLGPAWRGDNVTKIAITTDEPRELGPFQLAFIETVFRAADAQASKGEKP